MTSFYKNVPIKDTLVIIKELIIEFLLTRTWFRFNDKFLTQTDGVAMGGPANSVVVELIKFTIKNESDGCLPFLDYA